MNAEEFDKALKMKRELEELSDLHAAEITLDGSAIYVRQKDRAKTGVFSDWFHTIEEAKAYLQGMTAGKRVAHLLGNKENADAPIQS